jgi:general stress protein 26
MYTQQVAEFARLVEDITVVMLTTHAADGSLRSRPLLLERIDPSGDLLFLTHRSSQKVGDVERDERVNVAFVNADGTRYVSVAGRAHLTTDRAQASELWRPSYRAWFPKGQEDPDLAVLTVTIDSVDYWDVPSSRLVRWWDAARAIATGTPAQTSERRTLT